MPASPFNPLLTESQRKVLHSILEDIFYLENSLKSVENEDLIHLSHISIIFNYIALETIRNFYCEKLSIKKDRKTGNYRWKSFFMYGDHKSKITLILQKKQYIDFKKIKDMEIFIDTLRKKRNLILHRNVSPKNPNKELQKYLKNITRKELKGIFINSKNCIEIMNYSMELSQKKP